MKLRKIVSFLSASALILGMVPTALASYSTVPANPGSAPYGDGVYADPIYGEVGEIEIGEVRVGTAVNYPNDYAPWDRQPTLQDLQYTSHGQTEVPVEVRFQRPLAVSGTNQYVGIDLSNITVSGAVNGKSQQFVFAKHPAEFFQDTKYLLHQLADSDPLSLNWSGTMDESDAYRYQGQDGREYYLLWVDRELVRAQGLGVISAPGWRYTNPNDGRTYVRGWKEDGADGRYLAIGYERRDPARRLMLITLPKGMVDNQSWVWNVRQPIPNASVRYDVPSWWGTDKSPRYCSLTVLVPVTTDIMTVTLTAPTSSRNYFGSFTVKDKGTTAMAYIKSAAKADVNAAFYSINGFTKNTVTLATSLGAGTEFAFEQTLMDKDGALLPDGRYTVTNLRATVDNAAAGYLAPVRAVGYVQNSVLTVYVTTPATSDSYHVTGELRNAAGNIAYKFNHIYTVSRSGALYPSAISVEPSQVTLKKGETKEIKVLTASTGLDLTKAVFVSKNETVATVAKNAGTNVAVITGVALGSTTVEVSVPGAVAYPVVVNVVSAEGSFEDSVANLTKMVVRVNTRLNVRSAPSTASGTTVVGKLQNGFVVYMDPAKSSDTWLWVTYKTDIGGKTVIVQGYAYARYLDLAN